MDDPEGLAGLIFALLAVWSWSTWYRDLYCINKLAAHRPSRIALFLTPPAFLLVLLPFLLTAAAYDVRTSPYYTGSYLVIGAGWLGVSTRIFPFLGISVRDDALEHRNMAALVASLGAMAAVLCCFIGGNIGEGPGVEVVLISAGGACGCLLLLWLAIEKLTSPAVSERITVGRDLGAGVRLAAILAADGAILGFAAAGDWIPGRFARDFALCSWPAALLTIVAIGIESFYAEHSSLPKSILTSILYLGAASFYVYIRSSA